jgi:hypothetical protein
VVVVRALAVESIVVVALDQRKEGGV